MADDAKPQSWWQTLPGILTSATAAITAIAGLIAVLHQFSSSSTPVSPPQPAAAASVALSPQALMTPAAVTTVNPPSTEGGIAKHQVLTGRFANRCGCWGSIKIGSTHPDLRCQSGLAVARKCGAMMCPNGYNAWHYQCE
ncbi:MAG TPA: hypothetical protein VHY56_05790 [Candidatus Binataceae bacterium]|nr:hypothetical protein [Candidatus Binataceae bacterium]